MERVQILMQFKKLQFEHFGLKDEEVVDVLVELVKQILQHKSFWEAMRNCRLEGNKRDFFFYLSGYEIGLRMAKASNCPDVKCCECPFRELCNIYTECRFFGNLMKIYVEQGEEKLREFIRFYIKRRRWETFDESVYIG